MSSENSLPGANRDSFSRNAYLVLTMLIQAVAFGVFVYSLTVLQWHALNRWPFLVTEFVTVVIITFGHLAVARDLAWHIDLLDVLLPYLIGLLECLPMLLLGRVQNDAMWWFVCYLGIMNVTFANLINTRVKTHHTVALPLVRRRIILAITHPFLLLLAIIACYFEWHVELVGALFMVEQIGVVASLYWLDLRTRRNSTRSKNEAQQGAD